MPYLGDYPSCTIVDPMVDHSYRIEEGRTIPSVGETMALLAGRIGEVTKMQKHATSAPDRTTVDHG